MKNNSKNNIIKRIFLLLLCFILILYLIPFFIPTITHLFASNQIINNHIKEIYTSDTLLGNVNNSFKWLNDSYIPYGENRILPLYGVQNGFYEVNNKTVLFIRPNSVSWFILTKIGNCGENANYMKEIFKRLNYDVRKVTAIGGDHNIIQIVYNNVSYFIDPSAKQILNQTTYFENSQWARIIAITTNGTELDLTNEIISNKSNVSLKQNTTQKTNVIIKSTYLMSNNGMYKKPILVYKFQSDNESIIISSGTKYVVEFYRYFGLFKFSIENELDLSTNKTIIVNSVPLKFSTLKLTLNGHILILILCSLIIYYNIKWLIKNISIEVKNK